MFNFLLTEANKTRFRLLLILCSDKKQAKISWRTRTQQVQ